MNTVSGWINKLKRNSNLMLLSGSRTLPVQWKLAYIQYSRVIIQLNGFWEEVSKVVYLNGHPIGFSEIARSKDCHVLQDVVLQVRSYLIGGFKSRWDCKMDTDGAVKDHSTSLTCTSQGGGGGWRGWTCCYPEHQAIILTLWLQKTLANKAKKKMTAKRMHVPNAS